MCICICMYKCIYTVHKHTCLLVHIYTQIYSQIHTINTELLYCIKTKVIKNNQCTALHLHHKLLCTKVLKPIMLVEKWAFIAGRVGAGIAVRKRLQCFALVPPTFPAVLNCLFTR